MYITKECLSFVGKKPKTPITMEVSGPGQKPLRSKAPRSKAPRSKAPQVKSPLGQKPLRSKAPIL